MNTAMFLVVILFGAVPLEGPDAAFAAGRYEDARTMYGEALEGLLSGPDADGTDEPASVGPLLFNLGCCASRLADHAEAVWYMQRAARVMPHDREVLDHLRLAEQAANPLAADLDVIDRAIRWVGVQPPGGVLLGVLLGQTVGLLGLLFLGRTRTRRGVFALLVLVSLGVGWWSLKNSGHLPRQEIGVVLVHDAPLFAEPHHEDRVVRRLPAGGTVAVIEGSSQWVRVEYRGETGWCSRSSIARVE